MLAGEAETSRQTAGAFVGEIADAWLLGGGLEELEDPAARYRSVIAEDVLSVTSRSLPPEGRRWVWWKRNMMRGRASFDEVVTSAQPWGGVEQADHCCEMTCPFR